MDCAFFAGGDTFRDSTKQAVGLKEAVLYVKSRILMKVFYSQ